MLKVLFCSSDSSSGSSPWDALFQENAGLELHRSQGGEKFAAELSSCDAVLVEPALALNRDAMKRLRQSGRPWLSAVSGEIWQGASGGDTMRQLTDALREMSSLREGEVVTCSDSCAGDLKRMGLQVHLVKTGEALTACLQAAIDSLVPSAAVSSLKVLVLSYDEPKSNCAWLRVIQLLVDPSVGLHWFSGTESLADSLNACDVVLVQRGFPQNVEAMAELKASGKPWVYEADDCLWQDLPESNYHREYFRQLAPLLKQALCDCDIAITSTVALGTEMEKFAADVCVVPNLLDLQLWGGIPEPPSEGPVVIMYAGTATHAADLALVEDVLERIAAKYGDRVAFRFLGCSTPRLEALPGAKSSGFSAGYADYARMLRQLGAHIALAPLEDNSFNRAKSEIKWLEYSACHCAGVYADLPPYQQVVRDGENGFLAGSDPDVWYDRIDRLVGDADLRRRLAQASYEAAIARHAVVKGRSPLIQVLREAAQRGRKVLAVSAVTAANEDKVSIVIPVHGRLDLTKACLEAVEHTVHTPVELIVVDDASTDGSADWLRAEAGKGRLKFVANPKNLGFARSCNAGAGVATGRYVLFLNNDTVAHEGWLDALLQTAAAHPECGLAGSRLLYPDGRVQHAGIAFDGNGVPDHPWRFAAAEAPEVMRAQEVPAVTGACILLPMALFRELGGFDEKYPMYVEDVDLCLRVWRSGHSVRYVPASVLTHLEGSSTTDLERRARNSQAGLQRMWDLWKGCWPEPVRRHAWAPAWQRRDFSLRWSGPELVGPVREFAGIMKARLGNVVANFVTDDRTPCDVGLCVDDLLPVPACRAAFALLLHPASLPTPDRAANLAAFRGVWCTDAAWIPTLKAAGYAEEKIHLLREKEKFNLWTAELISELAAAAQEQPAVAGVTGMPSVCWYGPVFNCSGHARQAREAIAGLEAAGVSVNCDPQHSDRDFLKALEGTSEELAWGRRLNASRASDVLIVCDLPADADGRVDVLSEASRGHAEISRRAAWCTFETDRLPASWIPRLAAVDEVWVPSTFNREAFRKAGVPAEKLFVVPEGIDPEPYRHPEPHVLPEKAGFTFLSVFQWSLRKGWDVLLEAWAEAFSPEDDVQLVLRSSAFARDLPSVAEQADAFLASRGFSWEKMAPVVLLADSLPEAQMPGLYAASDAFVLPSRGEGWGLPYLEALAAGKPCIATAWGGQMDFLNEENSWLLAPGELVSPSAEALRENRFLAADHRWANPSAGELAKLLRYAWEHRDEGVRKGEHGQAEVAEKWSRARAASVMLERVRALTDRPTPSERPAPVKGADPLPTSVTEQPLHLRWEGSFFVNHSLAEVNRELCLQLALRGHDLSLVPYEPDEFTPGPGDRMEPLVQLMNAPLEAKAELHVRHQWPPQLVAPTDGHWVAIQPWEFGAVPKDWIDCWKNDLDELWVPSQFVKDGYVASGMPAERIAVIPNGVDVDRFCPEAPALKLPTKKSFRFLFVGGTIYRKGIDLLLTAYARTFRDTDDVCLVVKGMGSQSFYKGQTADNLFERFQNDAGNPELLVMDDPLTDAEMPGLYTACQCLVHPYRGEGFGMPIAEAMASGLPVVVTDGGPAPEFCGEDSGWFIPARRRDLPNRCVGDFICAGQPWLLEPDVDALGRLLRRAREDLEAGREKGRCGRRRMVQGYTWRHMAARVEERLRVLSGQAVQRQIPGLEHHNLLDPSCRNTEAVVEEDRLNLLLMQVEPALLRGDMEEVTKIVEEAVERFSGHPLSWLTRAMVRRGQRRFTAALKDIEQSITCRETPEALQEAVRCYHALGKEGDAKRLLGRLEREHGDWCRTMRNAGKWVGDEIRRGSGKHKKAK